MILLQLPGQTHSQGLLLYNPLAQDQLLYCWAMLAKVQALQSVHNNLHDHINLQDQVSCKFNFT